MTAETPDLAVKTGLDDDSRAVLRTATLAHRDAWSLAREAVEHQDEWDDGYHAKFWSALLLVWPRHGRPHTSEHLGRAWHALRDMGIPENDILDSLEVEAADVQAIAVSRAGPGAWARTAGAHIPNPKRTKDDRRLRLPRVYPDDVKDAEPRHGWFNHEVLVLSPHPGAVYLDRARNLVAYLQGIGHIRFATPDDCPGHIDADSCPCCGACRTTVYDGSKGERGSPVTVR